MSLVKEVRGFGWLKDHPDPRDWPYAASSAVLEEMPLAEDLRNENMPPVFDQSQLGSCSANAVNACLEYIEDWQSQKPLRLSRLESYYYGRLALGTVQSDSGSMIRDVVKGTAEYGISSEKVWPYDLSKFTQAPPVSRKSARFHKTIEYRSIDESNETAMQGCIAEGFPFVFGFAVYRSFLSIGDDGWWNPAPGEPIIGYHAVVCCGYDFSGADPRWIIRNSWNTSFGDQGYYYVPRRYMTAEAWDCWTIRKST